MLIYLFSNDSKSLKLYPNNVLSDFRIQLPHPFNLSGKWEIALMELQFPFTWIEEKMRNLIIRYRLSYVVENQPDMVIDYFIEIDDVENKNVDDILQILNDKEDKSLRFTRNDDNYINMNVQYQTFDKAVVENTLVVWCVEVEFSDTLRDIFGFTENKIDTTSELSHTASKHPFLPMFMPLITVHCDLIEPQYVSNSLKKILRVIATRKKQFSRVQTEIIEDPLYIPLRHTHFSSIRLSLLDVFDDRVKFEGGVIVATLDIRPIKT